jgi:hypothetical protein
MGPVVWHLWIYSRSANANFYFGVTLAFATAQVSMKFISWENFMKTHLQFQVENYTAISHNVS